MTDIKSLLNKEELEDLDLTNEERDRLCQVIRRNEELERYESKRIEQLETEVKALDRSRDEFHKDPRKQCSLCGFQFGLIFNRGELCSACKKKIVCNQCRQLIPTSTTKWACLLCLKQQELRAKSCAWFYARSRGRQRRITESEISTTPDDEISETNDRLTFLNIDDNILINSSVAKNCDSSTFSRTKRNEKEQIKTKRLEVDRSRFSGREMSPVIVDSFFPQKNDMELLTKLLSPRLRDQKETPPSEESLSRQVQSGDLKRIEIEISKVHDDLVVKTEKNFVNPTVTDLFPKTKDIKDGNKFMDNDIELSEKSLIGLRSYKTMKDLSSSLQEDKNSTKNAASDKVKVEGGEVFDSDYLEWQKTMNNLFQRSSLMDQGPMVNQQQKEDGEKGANGRGSRRMKTNGDRNHSPRTDLIEYDSGLTYETEKTADQPVIKINDSSLYDEEDDSLSIISEHTEPESDDHGSFLSETGFKPLHKNVSRLNDDDDETDIDRALDKMVMEENSTYPLQKNDIDADFDRFLVTNRQILVRKQIPRNPEKVEEESCKSDAASEMLLIDSRGYKSVTAAKDAIRPTVKELKPENIKIKNYPKKDEILLNKIQKDPKFNNPSGENSQKFNGQSDTTVDEFSDDSIISRSYIDEEKAFGHETAHKCDKEIKTKYEQVEEDGEKQEYRDGSLLEKSEQENENSFTTFKSSTPYETKTIPDSIDRMQLTTQKKKEEEEGEEEYDESDDSEFKKITLQKLYTDFAKSNNSDALLKDKLRPNPHERTFSDDGYHTLGDSSGSRKDVDEEERLAGDQDEENLKTSSPLVSSPAVELPRVSLSRNKRHIDKDSRRFVKEGVIQDSEIHRSSSVKRELDDTGSSKQLSKHVKRQRSEKNSSEGSFPEMSANSLLESTTRQISVKDVDVSSEFYSENSSKISRFRQDENHPSFYEKQGSLTGQPVEPVGGRADDDEDEDVGDLYLRIMETKSPKPSMSKQNDSRPDSPSLRQNNSVNDSLTSYRNDEVKVDSDKEVQPPHDSKKVISIDDCETENLSLTDAQNISVSGVSTTAGPKIVVQPEIEQENVLSFFVGAKETKLFSSLDQQELFEEEKDNNETSLVSTTSDVQEKELKKRQETTSTSTTSLKPFSRPLSALSASSMESISSYSSTRSQLSSGNIVVTGEIELKIAYNEILHSLELFIKQCRGLAAVDTKKQRSDPYIKSYLLPDKTKTGKRKSAVRKNTLNPVFTETLRYTLSMEEVKKRTLWISVCHKSRLSRNKFLGEVIIPLENHSFRHISDDRCQWFTLDGPSR